MVNFLKQSQPNQLLQSPRSALVAALLNQTQQNQGRPSYGLAGSLNIAAAPIMAALLAKKNAQEEQRKTEAQRAALSQALGIPPVSPMPSQTAPPWNEDQKRMSALISGLGPEGIQAAQGALLQQTLTPKAQTVPLSEQEKAALGIPKELFAQRNMSTGEIQLHNPPGPLVNINTGEGFVPLSDAEKQQAGIDPKVFAQRNVKTGQIDIHANPAPDKTKETDTEKRNRSLYNSVLEAESQIQSLKGGTDTSSLWQSFLGGAGVGKVFQSEAYRKYEAAGQRWAANILYLKSGATANAEEVRSTWKQYFPQPGDGPEVALQKEQARLQEIESLRSNFAPDASKFSTPNAVDFTKMSDEELQRLINGK